jgi:hypothetical protein
MPLRHHPYHDPWTGESYGQRTITWSGPDRPTLATVALTITAATLAEPLRRAFRQHLATHDHPHGFGHCPEAMRLSELLPPGDQIVVG